MALSSQLSLGLKVSSSLSSLNHLLGDAYHSSGIFKLQIIIPWALQLELIHLPKAWIFGVVAIAHTGVGSSGDCLFALSGVTELFLLKSPLL